MHGEQKGIIAWFIRNPVAANLLVCIILLAGFLSATSIEKELLPVPEAKNIFVTAGYPSASPKEVEEGVTLKIEEALKEISDIKKVQSYSTIGFSSVMIDLEDNADVDLVLEEVKTRVDSISTFSKDVENITVRKSRPVELALQLQLYGNLDELQAKRLAQEIRHELLTRTIVKKVNILNTRPFEININVSPEQLQKYKVTMSQVAARIRAESVTAPLGGISNSSESILIKVEGQAYRQADFENIVLLTTESGAKVRLKDIADVQDGFVNAEKKGLFDGQYSVGIAISAVGEQDVVEVADAVKKYLAEKQKTLPQGIYLTDWLDTTYYLQSRLDTMTSNLIYGGLLVFLLLVLFMDLKMAFWVVAGIPVSVAGAFILMQMGFANVTLNMVSMFGFIMIVGIVIDDSIVVAESVDDEIRKSGFTVDSVIRGTKRVATPAIFGILTTIAAFSPMLIVGGMKQVYLFAVGFVACSCLLFSLMESKWVLPAHLMSNHKGLLGRLHSRHQHALQEWMNRKLSAWIQKRYLPFVTRAVEYRYLTLSIFIVILAITLGAYKSGIIRYELFPAEVHDYITANFSVTQGLTEEEGKQFEKRIEDALFAVEADYQKEFSTDNKLIKHYFTYGTGAGSGMVVLELTKSETRDINSFEVAERWREKVGDVEGAVLDISGAKTEGSRSLSFLLRGTDKKELEAAAEDLVNQMKAIDGLTNPYHTIEKGRQEYLLELKPKAEAMGLTLADIGVQVKDVFHGIEVQKILRDNEEIPVRVKFPDERRRSIVDIEAMQVRLPDGRFMQLKELADIDTIWAENNLMKVNGELSVYVKATVEQAVPNPGVIADKVNHELIPRLLIQYPGVNARPEGVSESEQETEQEIRHYLLIVLMLIYILLAIPLKSYVQPLIIMSAIPFGFVGAAWGHWLLDYPISVMSLFGLIALSGIIVNDTLVLIDQVNNSVEEDGMDIKEASIQGGALRFRAIMLTSVTTFLGDLPIILETSIEAANMIPMAISLGIGIMFATAIILVLVPCLYNVLGDIQRLFGNVPAKPSTQA